MVTGMNFPDVVLEEVRLIRSELQEVSAHVARSSQEIHRELAESSTELKQILKSLADHEARIRQADDFRSNMRFGLAVISGLFGGLMAVAGLFAALHSK